MGDAVNRVWFSMDVGNFNVGKKVSAFFGGDNYEQAYGNLVAAFGEPAAAEIVGHLFELSTEDAFANLKAGGVVGGSSGGVDPKVHSTAAGPVCHHGPRVFKESKPGAAKAWKAWMCPAPQGAPDQCKPEWIK